MEGTIRIVTDSSCDLPPHLVEAFEIEVVPLIVRFGTDVYRDGELSAEEFWEKASGVLILERMFIFGQHTSLWVDLDDPEGLPELSTVSECSTRDKPA